MGLRDAPGTGSLPFTLRGWLEHRSHLPSIQGPVRWAWSVAGIADAIRSNRNEEALARSLLLLAAADQAAVDSGNWLLAQELLLLRMHPLPGTLLPRRISSNKLLP